MKAWLIFLIGLLCGVGALVAVQQIPRGDRSGAPVAVAKVDTAALAPPQAAAATAAPASMSTPMSALTQAPTPNLASSPAIPEPAAPVPAVVPVAVATTPEPAVAGSAAPADALVNLLLPVQDVTFAQLSDTFTDARGEGRVHDAIDIMAARGTPVLATADGTVAKLFTSVRGGTTIYQFDPARTHAYYYAHLDRYADGLVEGKLLHRGDVIGYVGSTGNASPDGPHLHFAIFVLGPEKKWWQGQAINPYPLLRATR